MLAAAASARALTSADGITVASQHRLDSRLTELTVTTPALKGTADVRILLPDGYAADPSKRYPVLYLLDGTSGHASDWTTMGDAEQTTAEVRRQSGTLRLAAGERRRRPIESQVAEPHLLQKPKPLGNFREDRLANAVVAMIFEQSRE